LVEYFSNYATRQFKKLDFEKNAFKDEKVIVFGYLVFKLALLFYIDSTILYRLIK